MSKRVVLHIGTMKTGTTYLQGMLRFNAETLAAEGHHFGAVHRATASAVGQALAKPNTPSATKAWSDILQAACNADADASVISCEFLSFAKPHQIRALVAPAGDTPIDVVVTLRDQSSLIASQWQTFCRNFGDVDWPTYLKKIDPQREPDKQSRAWKSFYRAQSISRTVTDWSAAAGVNSVTALVLPHERTSDRWLWDSFMVAAGLGPIEPQDMTAYPNPSVGHGSAQMLQELGHTWREIGFPLPLIRQGMRPLIAEALNPLRASESRPVIDRPGFEFARRQNIHAHETLTELSSAGKIRIEPGIGFTSEADALSRLLSPPEPAGLLSAAKAAPKAEKSRAAKALLELVYKQIGSTDRVPMTYAGRLEALRQNTLKTPGWQEAIVDPRFGWTGTVPGAS